MAQSTLGKLIKPALEPVLLYPGPRGFLDETKERKKGREKTSGCGRCESH